MKHTFDKFINQEKNSKKKEALRQEKRKWKQERNKKYEELNKKYEAKGTRYKHQKRKVRSQSSETRSTRSAGNDTRQGNRKLQTQITKRSTSDTKHPTSEMPLNKFIAHAGVCGRREAAALVKEGKIKVNNAIVYEPGFKVTSNDKIIFNGKELHVQKNLVYILLNKPKDYITTAKDEQGRKTVFQLIERATDERVYPVGRL